MMVTSECKAEIQDNGKSDGGERTRRYHEQRAIAFANQPDDVRLRRFPQEFAAIALAEVFGIKDGMK